MMTKLCRFSGEQCFDRFLLYWQYVASEYLLEFAEVSLMILLQSRGMLLPFYSWGLKLEAVERLTKSITERDIISDTLSTTWSTEAYSSLLHPNHTNLKLNSLPSAYICYSRQIILSKSILHYISQNIVFIYHAWSFSVVICNSHIWFCWFVFFSFVFQSKATRKPKLLFFEGMVYVSQSNWKDLIHLTN